MAPPVEYTGSRRAGGVDVGSLAIAVRRYGPGLAGWLLPFLLVLYLALKQGGYDGVVRGEVGVAIWWIVLVGAAVGLLPAARLSRNAWIVLGLLAGFALWTGLAIGWSESAERSVAELGRVAMLLGVFVLALTTQTSGAARRVLAAIASATVVVAVVASLSRMQPGLFPTEDIVSSLPTAQNRLSYPFGYWNGLAHFMALGLPIVISLAAAARLTVVRALAAGAIPMLVFTGFLTLSRGGVAAGAVAVIVLFALYPRRLQLLPGMILGGIGSALLISGAAQRADFQDGLLTPAADTQGAEMLALAVIVCGGVALLQAAVALSERHRLLPAFPSPSRQTAVLTTGAIAFVAVCIALAAGAPSRIGDAWQEFKQPSTAGSGVERLYSTSGSNRYQYWQSAIDANSTDPLLGIGPGSFEYWWARDNPLEDSTGFFVRDAHSLYLETLGELGIVGFALIVALVGYVLVTGGRRAFRRHPKSATVLAAATAGAAAFATSAAVDWVWELTVMPVSFLLLAAVIFGRDTDPEANPTADASERREPRLRVALFGLAVIALVVVSIPFAGLAAIEESQAEARSSSLQQALVDARTASEVQPYASSPYLQEALILERAGELDAAAAAAIKATEEETTNWRPFLILSRIQAARGNTKASIAAFHDARSLNPRSPLFSQ